jgi:type II secretory pathway component GspD/PulD (secretin)
MQTFFGLHARATRIILFCAFMVSGFSWLNCSDTVDAKSNRKVKHNAHLAEESCKEEASSRARLNLDSDESIERYLSQAFFDRALQSRTISIRSKPADIADVIELIGVSAGIDFVIDERVAGATGKLFFENRTAGDALQMLASRNHPPLAIIKERAIWRIMVYEDAVAHLKKTQQDAVIKRCFVLHHARCDESVRQRVEQMWQRIVSVGGYPNGYCSVECESKKVFVRGFKRHVVELERFIKEIDCSVARVRIDAVVAEIDSKYEQQMGFNWSTMYQPGTSEELNFVSIGSHAQATGQAATAQLVQNKSAVTIPFLFGGNDLNLQRLLIELHAAETKSKARILLKPSVLTNNLEMAEILIGSSVPIKTMVEDFVHGKSHNVQTVHYKDVGTILNVRPTVSADLKTVQLDIWVENSSVVGPVSDMAPTIKTIRTRNKVTLRSGQTTAISGLMLKRDQSGSNKISFLERIPILGALFRGDGKMEQESQMIIFMTPTVV